MPIDPAITLAHHDQFSELTSPNCLINLSILTPRLGVYGTSTLHFVILQFHLFRPTDLGLISVRLSAFPALTLAYQTPQTAPSPCAQPDLSVQLPHLLSLFAPTRYDTMIIEYLSRFSIIFACLVTHSSSPVFRAVCAPRTLTAAMGQCDPAESPICGIQLSPSHLSFAVGLLTAMLVEQGRPVHFCSAHPVPT